MNRQNPSVGLIATAVVACAACNPAVSETRPTMTDQNPAASDDALQDVNERALGFWRLSSGSESCLIALNRLPGEGGGFGVHVERCSAKGLAGAVRWRSDGEAVVIEDAEGRMLIRLNPEGRGWAGRDGEGVAWRMEETPA